MAADFWGFHTVIRLGAHRMHVSTHRTSAASALAISAVGAGETESNHVYCRISFEIMLFMHSAFRGRGRNVRRTRFRSAIWLPHAGRAARRRRVGRSDSIPISIRGIAIGAELLRTGPGVETRVAVGTLEAS